MKYSYCLRIKPYLDIQNNAENLTAIASSDLDPNHISPELKPTVATEFRKCAAVTTAVTITTTIDAANTTNNNNNNNTAITELNTI
jgi:hypothetical protein